MWYEYWAEPITDCEFYNKCGNYGSCTDGNTPICTCLQGFVPKSNDEWNSGNWTKGCVRRTPLQCERNSSDRGKGEADGFLQLQGVKLPDLSDWDQNVLNISSCEQTCLANCACKAYSYVTGIGCLRWGKDLVDIHVFSSGGDDLYLRLAGSELGKIFSMFSLDIVLLVCRSCINSDCDLYLRLAGQDMGKIFPTSSLDLVLLVCVCDHVCMLVFVSVCVHMCMCTCACMCMHVCTHACAHA